MRRGIAVSVSPRQKPNFAVELRANRRGFHPVDVEKLIRECPFKDGFEISHSGFIAGRLFFVQWSHALDAIAFVWERRLRGEHLLNPKYIPIICASSDYEELSTRLRRLFADHIRDLLEGEVVQRCQKKIETIDAEIDKVSAVLRRGPNRFAPAFDIFEKKKGLEVERQQVSGILEEFREALTQILFQIDGSRWDDCSRGSDYVDLFKFSGDLNWNRIHHRIVRECRRLEEGLPIYACRSEILRRIHLQQVMVLIGETGSGKSTQLVQYLADSGLGDGGTIICTQPRKIAVTSLTQRVVEESDGCYLENSVICHPTYSSAQRLNYMVIFMTDNCLLQHCMFNSNLGSVSYIVVDEAHERSLHTDLLLALVKNLLLQRSDLRLIIMSATADASKLSEYFYGCCTIHVKGRNFFVDIEYVTNIVAESSCATLSKYNPVNCPLYFFDVVKMVNEIHRKEGDGAILAFLTSQIEVEWACEKFQVPSAVALPLHGKLSCEEQNCVFKNYPGKRKIIFATNLAETSLTIPGVKYVVDCGMVKESRFEPSTGMNVLKVCRISQSSAKQRAGRAGRTEPGKCYRLYSEQDLQAMPCHQEPEICRVHLGIAVLKILSLGIKKVQGFDFIDAPSPKAIDAAIRNLIQLSAVTRKDDVLELTDCGHYLVKLGIEPRLGKLIQCSFNYGLGREGLVLATLMANASSIFCRVGSDEEKSKSDCLKVRFCHCDGDLFTLLSVYKEWESEPLDKRNKWCWNNSINARSMRRCEDTILELEICLQRELNTIIPSYWLWQPDSQTKYDKLLKTVILSSLTENVAVYSGYDRLGYEVALTGQQAQLHPSCSLLVYGQKPGLVVFGELLSIPKQYLVCVTSVDYECLDSIMPPVFDVLELNNRRMQKNVITGVGSKLLRRFCGKLNNNLHCLVSRIQSTCMDSRIGIDVDFDKREIILFATEKHMQKVSSIVSEALEYEKKWIREECVEKCLFRGGPGSIPSLALFGAGAEIMHLELEKRFLTVEVSHPNARALDDKELVMMFDKCTTGIGSFHKYGGIGQERENLEKWGKITFLCSDDAEKAVVELNDVEVQGSLLKVCPLRATFGDHMFPFPAVKAKVFWPRRQSKGIAIIRCALQDVAFVAEECSGLIIRGKPVRSEISNRHMDSVFISGLDRDVVEQDVWNGLRNVTKRRIMDVFLLRGEAVNQPLGVACAEALLREIANFVPTDKCRVHVYSPEPKDYLMKALITFDGSLHLRASMALEHLQGNVLSGCLPWQKIHCQHMFHSSVSCLAPVYSVIKKHLDSLFESLKHQRDLFLHLERADNGSFHVRISSVAMRTVAQCRWSLEQLMKGKIVSHPSLTASVLQLLFTRDGIVLLRSLEQETRTLIQFDRQNLNLRVFGPPEKVASAEQRLVRSLLTLHEDKQLEIHLRARLLPDNLMKEVVRSFGPDLHGLKEKIPDAEFRLNTHRHLLSVFGSKESKREAESIIADVAKRLNGGGDKPAELANGESACPICLCEVDDESYWLEACGHQFCKVCLVEQCESAISSREGFPLCCVRECCGARILLTDLRSLLSAEQFEELFRASLGAFVMSSRGAYRFCPTPDCPSVYSVAGPETSTGLFSCGACASETCTKCHLEYHPFMSCERYKEFKEDPDSSLKEWCRGKEHVKRCPVCGFTIEKLEGCNHIECKCGNHICWVCLDCFPSGDDCYMHLRSVHHAII